LERAAATPAAAPSGGGNPTGTYITGAWATAPDGYLMMGTSVPNADTAHPDLWAIVPASWKSGTTLNLPDMDDRTLMGGGTLGDVGGSNEATIDAANLPLHLHDMDHNHPAGTTGGQSADHTPTATGSGSNADLARPGGATFSFTDISNAGDTADGTHSHGTGGVSAGHTHSFDVSDFTGATGATGSLTPDPFDTTPAHLRVNVAIKT
jgi:microcystin-dependent protein